jgi:hypothetical protein
MGGILPSRILICLRRLIDLADRARTLGRCRPNLHLGQVQLRYLLLLLTITPQTSLFRIQDLGVQQGHPLPITLKAITTM